MLAVNLADSFINGDCYKTSSMGPQVGDAGRGKTVQCEDGMDPACHAAATFLNFFLENETT